MATAKTSVNIKMYRVGELGDCFLITFKHGTTTRHLLIDCGSFRNSVKSGNRLEEIVKDIKKEVKGGKLDIVVGTHQHNDHLSGFVHCEELFNEIGVEQVWLSWLDNPRDKQATTIEENHIGLRTSLIDASEKMQVLEMKAKANKNTAHIPLKGLTETKALIDGLLGFYGAAPALPAKGVEILKKIGTNQPKYLKPGQLKTIPGIPDEVIKIHVLGPPKDEKLLYRKDPKKGESYDKELRAMKSMANHFNSALNNRNYEENRQEEQFPFNKEYKRFMKNKIAFSNELVAVTENYLTNENEWRNIDSDWLEQAAHLALYMDTFTNNSSLVLAIEIVQSNKVLLFAADAQTGNWVSWQDLIFEDKEMTIDNLLSNTVLYKVGHHGSHNSTLKNDLEKMTHEQLVAMIPVDETDPNITKVNGWKMPATNLYKRLKEKTNYRILRMDKGFADECDPAKDKNAKKSWKGLSKPVITDLYIEYSIK